jgi:hypothetical protein
MQISMHGYLINSGHIYCSGTVLQLWKQTEVRKISSFDSGLPRSLPFNFSYLGLHGKLWLDTCFIWMAMDIAMLYGLIFGTGSGFLSHTSILLLSFLGLRF